ncbi:MAG: tRNA (adenine(22)-N(1))-methyltransferase TrmK [Deltaproteobacteria bacterium]|nr:tRNA (adenine(22)-N(1))-methyltransferase TrmK [Deltaproteobacteria bacterium]MBI3754863.1 tRNA (adenine(22)-N(1))-methyltransferase TrmK [Deltaproteobacteria bacterium]
MYSANLDETLDELDSLKIIQKKNGYRFSADSVQLANFILPLQSTDSVIDIGTGSGVIPLILAKESPVQNIIGIEIQKSLVDIAKRNVELNDLSSRIRILEGDFRVIADNQSLEKNSFSAVISNPPYTKFASGRISPSSEKAMAKMELASSLNNLVNVSKYLAAEDGRICYIYPLSRLQEMISVIQGNGLELVRLEFVSPKPACKAKRVLIEVMAK